jgi:hypothetical protein
MGRRSKFDEWESPPDIRDYRFKPGFMKNNTTTGGARNIEELPQNFTL